jgi:hypothetical protein
MDATLFKMHMLLETQHYNHFGPLRIFNQLFQSDTPYGRRATILRYGTTCASKCCSHAQMLLPRTQCGRIEGSETHILTPPWSLCPTEPALKRPPSGSTPPNQRQWDRPKLSVCYSRCGGCTVIYRAWVSALCRFDEPR